MTSSTNYQQATIKTANDLRGIAQSEDLRSLSQLSLPEIEAVVNLTAQIMPAGNVPGMILSGLARTPGRRMPLHTMQQHISILFKGIEQILDKMAYGAVFAGPAAVIWGYQNLLRLAGKDPDSSFPEGTWQFYADYALREDTARHLNETHGFDTILQQHNIRISEVDRMTSWVMASVACLHQYNALLELEWRERVATFQLREVVTAALGHPGNYEHLYRMWEFHRPYRRDAEAANFDYTTYRRRKFDDFMLEMMRGLSDEIRKAWADRMSAATHQDLPAYQRQMSILAYLDPGPYGEMRTHFEISSAHIGLVYQGCYYMLPACVPGTSRPIEVNMVREQVAAILAAAPAHRASLIPLAQVRRASMADLRRKLNPALVKDLDMLRFAPIIINGDVRSAAQSLIDVRQAERGIGDHALTIFSTSKSFVFDQSHIFFDGTLGAALAEILTNEALSWAVYLSTQAPIRPAEKRIYTPLKLPVMANDLEFIRQSPRVTAEAGAEHSGINLKACTTLRRLFKQRNNTLQLTVNDLMILYRAIHAARYQPSAYLIKALSELNGSSRAAQLVKQSLDEIRKVNPAILIPIDASRRIPRDRLYPMCIEVPLMELDLLNLHQQVIENLDAYEGAALERTSAYSNFDKLQRTYLATLAGFGSMLGKWKEMAIQGESASVGAIKLLAHLPPALQHMLDKAPAKFEILNNMLKGREVFSNVGQVVPTSTLSRFVTAKDDNEQKQLSWGVLTDAQGVMRISLRDFRPHVAALAEIGRQDLANLIALDYLDSYVQGFNAYIRDLQRITIASRKTRLFIEKDAQ